MSSLRLERLGSRFRKLASVFDYVDLRPFLGHPQIEEPGSDRRGANPVTRHQVRSSLASARASEPMASPLSRADPRRRA